MFFRKRREEKQRERAAAAQAAEQARADAVGSLREKLAAALKMPDPVERCLALMDVSDAAGKIRKTCEDAIREKANQKTVLPEASLTITGFAVGLVLGPIAFITAGAGFAYGNSIGEKRAAKESARLRTIDKTLLDGMAEIADKADAAAKIILDSDPRQLAGSSKADDLMRRVPKLKDDMLAAFRKNHPAPPPEPGPKSGGFKL